MPSQDSLRLHDLGYIEQSGPNPRHPYQQRPVTTVQPQTRRRSPQYDVELMTEKLFSASSLLRDLNMSATNTTSKCRIARIELDDAMILAHVANPRSIKFSEGTRFSEKPARWILQRVGRRDADPMCSRAAVLRSTRPITGSRVGSPPAIWYPVPCARRSCWFDALLDGVEAITRDPSTIRVRETDDHTEDRNREFQPSRIG
jgi:hypothetical protein